MNSNFETLIELRGFIDASIAGENREISFENLTVQIENFEQETRGLQLEAMILLGHFLKKDAKKTINYLIEYKSMCVKANNQAYFDNFFKKCTKLISPRIITIHGYNLPIGTTNSELLTKGILSVVKAMDDIGYKVFINSGTLLGVIRDNTYIPHDDDVDFGVLLRASDPESAAHEWAELKNTLKEKGLLKAVGWLGAIFKTHNIGTFSVDLFPAWIEGDSAFVYPHTFGELSRGDIFPLRESDNTKLPIPNNPEKMLTVNYGPNWKTPDALFRFSWWRARNNFSIFLKIIEKMNQQKKT